MRVLAVALGLMSIVPAARAQVFPPGYVLPPGVGVGAPPVYAPARPEVREEEYWRHRDHEDWRRREEYREEARHEEWVREHCVRNFRGEEFCRR